MPVAASLAAILLYLVPVAVVVVCRARPTRPLWAAALDVPLAVAADLLVVLGLSRLATLEVATLASRALWLGGGLGYLLVRRRTAGAPAWPWALGPRALLATAVTGWAAAQVSTLGSRPYWIWDRKWHIPLVASLRGQSIPFDNVFRRGEVLHYHFAGDVHAAMLQALSGDVIHASLALSLAHDVLFGLIGVTLALLVVGARRLRVALPVLATLAALLAGPYAPWRGPSAPRGDGYSILNYFTMSFRPHDALAGLFLVGIAGALAARLHAGRKIGDSVPALLGSAAGLAISDETSLGILGLSLGVTWIFFPRILHPRRAVGAVILVGLLMAFVGPNVAFAASVAPGAQRHTVDLVPWRSPGYGNPPLLLARRDGAEVLLTDLGPTALLWLSAVLGALAARRPRGAGALAAFATGIFVLSALALTRVEVNHDYQESHRFMTAGVFLLPVLALLVLRAGGPRRPLLHAAAAGVGVLGAALGAGSTVSWIVSVLPTKGDARETFYAHTNFYAVDCRRDVGVALGAKARPRYLSQSIWYAYAGCQPTFAPAYHEGTQWALTIGYPMFGKEELRALRAGQRSPEDTLAVVCPRGAEASADPVCAYALGRAACHGVGRALTECELSPAQQAAASR